MWTVTLGAAGGVSSSIVNSALLIVQEAANYWGRYVDHSLANIQISVDIANLGGGTLASGGSDYYSYGSSGGFDFYEAVPVTELLTGIDLNGADADIFITIDRATLVAGEYYLGAPVEGVSVGLPSHQYDLLTVMIHEIGHGLGFASFIPDADGTKTSFDEHVVNVGGQYYFTGPSATAIYGDDIPLTNDDISHASESLGPWLMGPTVAPGTTYHMRPQDLAMFADYGVPVLAPTSGNDTLFGFYLGDTANLGAGNDHYSGLAGADTVNGENGDDVLDGGSADDALYGGDGDDTFFGGEGGDYIVGDAGFDVMDYSRDPVAIAVNLGPFNLEIPTGTLLPGWAADGYEDVDTLSGIEGVIGSAFNDTIVGSNSADDYLSGGDGADRLVGWFGSDTLLGGAGNDTLEGGSGGDSFDGGAGIDAATYADAGAGVVVYLDGTAGVNDVAAGDILVGVERLIGSGFTDSLFGADAANDYLGGEGSGDSLSGLSGNDMLTGGLGSDSLDGGAGLDAADYSESAAAVTVRLWNGTGEDGDAAGDAFVSIENVTGSGFGDTLEGADGVNNLLAGLAGSDALSGFSGNDILRGGDGADALAGGDGFDYADYTDAMAAVRIRLWNGTGEGNVAEGDALSGVEGVMGSGYADAVSGSSNGDYADGRNGNDSLYGAGGNDSLVGNAGNDFLQGGAGGDLLVGGAGADTLDYADSAAAVTVRLWNSTASGAGSSADGDVLSGFEHVIGSAFNDAVVGADNAANKLLGNGGNDGLYGLSGNDTIEGGAGADTMNGGDGFDYASYAGSSAGVKIRLWSGAGEAGDAQGDRLAAIEGVVGSNHDDVIIGAEGVANVLYGALGDDTLYGLSGNDTFVFAKNYDQDVIGDFAGAGAAAGDVIRLLSFGAAFNSFAEVMAAATQAGANTVIDFGGGDTLTLTGVSKASLHANDFMFG